MLVCAWDHVQVCRKAWSYMGQKWQVHAVWKWSPWHLDLQTAKSCRLPPHTDTRTDVETHTISPSLPSLFPSPLFSKEFKSKMNLSVTGQLQLQEKHTFQHMKSGREGRVERSRSCWDSQRRRAGSKGGAVVRESEKLVWFNVHAC